MVISIVMVIVGVVSFLSLPVAQYPNIVPPEIAVNTTYVGADALTVEQSVATPIEQQMSGVDHMNYMYSLNASNGTMKLTVNYDITTDPNIDQVLTQMRESQAESQLPSSVREIDFSAPDGYLALFAVRPVRFQVPGELCLHQSERPDCSGARYRERFRFRGGAICAPGLG
jgi:multidrug efflux pump subunit AcrB